ncbi:MAG: MMPL family transporter [Anaerovoracaceae bacterium]
MKSFPEKITNHGRLVIYIFLALAAVCSLLISQVDVNRNTIDYLPETAESTIALKVMDEEFKEEVPNARVMISNVTIAQAKEYKTKLEKIQGVLTVMWLDDVTDLKTPLETTDPKMVEQYYKDNSALFSVTIEKGAEQDATNDIYALIGEYNSASGEAINSAYAKEMTKSESSGAFMILIPLILIILILTTTSWIEPLLFLVTIGVSVLINLGTNIFLGGISDITLTISPILQLAVSLDYAIFLLHRFADCKKIQTDIKKAMCMAMRQSFSAIAASAATTLFGFLALVFMKFRIGPDLGINLAKGIILSYLAVMIFLPALTLCCYKLIEKTGHRRIIPPLHGVGKLLLKVRVPLFIVAVLLVVPCFMAQSQTSFLYGLGTPDPSVRVGQDSIKINETFGQSTAVVVLVPRGSPSKELALSNELESLNNVTSVVSYSKTIGSTIPMGYVDKAYTSQFYSKHYARIIVNADTNEEGDEAFAVVENIRETIPKFYDDSYTCGQSTNLYDMKLVVNKDTKKVNLIAILAIALVLLLTFRSLTIPVILLFVIETAIWINLSVPYFEGSSLCYIGFLVINTVQLGATIDYAILLTDSYKTNRQKLNKVPAMKKTLDTNFISLLTSATILSAAGFCLALTSTNTIIAQLGVLLGRGTLLSLTMVACVLPMLLISLDPLIRKTTIRPNFFQEVKK